ncbi:MAG: beta-glucuronidase [Solirubrobacteraceae bacterium]|nr:beta-glucuronidase [Solirubrobacteraceae bacterium]
MATAVTSRKLTLVLLVSVGLWVQCSATAHAQSAGPYAATAPTPGALYADGQDDRYLLGGQWLYQADPNNIGVPNGWGRGNPSTAGWSPVTVPNSYNAGNLSSASMAGSVGWYRRDFTLPAGAFPKYVPARFRSWIVRFESVNYDATVWLNGRQIGHHDGAYLPFEVALKGVRSGVNRLLIRVDDRRTASSLPPGPGGGWWNFGGLQREVYLRSVSRADISMAQVRPVLPCPTCAATINERATVTNPTRSPQTVMVQGVYGGRRLNFGGHTIPAGGTWVAHASTRLAAPHLWSIDNPYLYHATLTLSDARGRHLEGYFTNSGVRSIAVAPSGQVLLNGRALDVRGVNIHEQNIMTGAALGPGQLQALVGWTRELGGTIIRSHYPLNPEIAQMADQDGILLWSEIPVYQTSSSYLRNAAWLAHAHAELRENILVNQNHPSVMTWSIANELPNPPNDVEADYIAGATALAHQLDPTRPVSMAIVTWPGVGCQAAYSPLDIIGFNDYIGWFDEGGGTTADREALGPYLDFLHSCYPNKGLMVSEFGFEGNRHGPVEERGTYEFQADMARYHLGVIASKPYISGAIWFALQNFAAWPGWTGGNPLGDPPFVEKGEIDLQGHPTPLFPVIQSIYKSTTQIAPNVTGSARHRTAHSARHRRRSRHAVSRRAAS